jgi:hypothetical protein
VLSAPRLARADSVAVVLAGPDTADASNEVVNRVRGELVADGFHVATVLHASAVEREAAVPEKGRELGSAVAVGLFVGEDSSTIDVYLLDMTSGRTATTHMAGGPAGEVPEFTPWSSFARASSTSPSQVCGPRRRGHRQRRTSPTGLSGRLPMAGGRSKGEWVASPDLQVSVSP